MAKEITELLQTGGAAGDSAIGLDSGLGLVRRDSVPYDKDAAAVDSAGTDLFIGVSVSGEARTFNAIPYIKGDTAATPAVDDLVLGVGDDGSAKQFTVASLATTLEGESFGTAAFVNHGTAAGEVPLNSDLGSASLVDTGTDPGDVPLNSDLGMASLVNTGTGAGDVPLNSDLGSAAYVSGKFKGNVFDSLSILDAAATGTKPHDFCMTPDGMYLYIVDNATMTVTEYSLSESFNPITDTATGNTLDLTTELGSSSSVRISLANNGTLLFASGGNGTFKYSMTAGDLSTASYTGDSITDSRFQETAIDVASDGSYIYIMNLPTVVRGYPMGTAYSLASINTLTFDELSVSTATSLRVSADGGSLYLTNSAESSIRWYQLTTDFDVSTGVLSRTEDMGTVDIDALFVHPDSYYAFKSSYTNDVIYRFSLSLFMPL